MISSRTELISGIVVDISRKLFEFPAGRIRVQRLIFGLAENLRKVFWDQPSEEQVGVSHRQRTTLSNIVSSVLGSNNQLRADSPIASWTGLCSRTFRPS
jgi:hypothetical protein